MTRNTQLIHCSSNQASTYCQTIFVTPHWHSQQSRKQRLVLVSDLICFAQKNRICNACWTKTKLQLVFLDTTLTSNGWSKRISTSSNTFTLESNVLMIFWRLCNAAIQELHLVQTIQSRTNPCTTDTSNRKSQLKINLLRFSLLKYKTWQTCPSM